MGFIWTTWASLLVPTSVQIILQLVNAILCLTGGKTVLLQNYSVWLQEVELPTVADVPCLALKDWTLHFGKVKDSSRTHHPDTHWSHSSTTCHIGNAAERETLSLGVSPFGGDVTELTGEQAAF